MLIKTLRKGDTAILLCMLRDTDGTPLVSGDGTLSVVMKQDFSPFGTVALTGVSASLLAAPEGTVADPDPRWVPGVDGEDGFNVVVTIPGSHFSAVGTYIVTAKVTKPVGGTPTFTQVFRVHVGSGQ